AVASNRLSGSNAELHDVPLIEAPGFDVADRRIIPEARRAASPTRPPPSGAAPLPVSRRWLALPAPAARLPVPSAASAAAVPAPRTDCRSRLSLHPTQQIADVVVGRVQRQRLPVKCSFPLRIIRDEGAELEELRQSGARLQLLGGITALARC